MKVIEQTTTHTTIRLSNREMDLLKTALAFDSPQPLPKVWQEVRRFITAFLKTVRK